MREVFERARAGGGSSSVSIPERAEARVVCPRGGRTYEYPRHVAFLALVEERVVPERAHVALPGGRGSLPRVDVAVEIPGVVRLWNLLRVKM